VFEARQCIRVETHQVDLMGGGLTAGRSSRTWLITVFLRNRVSRVVIRVQGWV
jgi:hypothetical protein